MTQTWARLDRRVAGPMGYTSTATVAELEAGLAPAGTYVLPSWEQTALSSDQPEKVLVCGWGETAFMCRSGRHFLTACMSGCSHGAYSL